MIKTIRHTGVIVTEMEKALAFYRDLLGLKPVLDVERKDDFFDKLTGLAGARMRVVMLEAQDGNRVELFQFFSHPKQAPQQVDMSNIGCSHLAFSVEDIDKTYKVLSGKGVKFNCAPQVSPDGYARVTYCHDPDGAIIELVQILDRGRDPYAG